MPLNLQGLAILANATCNEVFLRVCVYVSILSYFSNVLVDNMGKQQCSRTYNCRPICSNYFEANAAGLRWFLIQHS